MKAVNLKCNSYIAPIQIDSSIPDFSWIIPCGNQGAAQTAYQIVVSFMDPLSDSNSDNARVWDSGKVISNQSIHVLYNGTPLEPKTGYTWRIKFWNENGVESQWSDPAFFATGLMQQWSAKWIGYDKLVGVPFDSSVPFYCSDDFELGENQYYLPPVPFLRKEFILEGQVRKATLFVSAFGLIETQINGAKAGTDYFVPGLSDYSKTVYSRAYDVTPLVHEGGNAVGVILADGWYAGYMGLNSREWYGDQPRAMVQLEVVLSDGRTMTVVSDDTWTASYGPLDESDIFQGESYDARKELTGWSEADYSEASWEPVDVGAKNNLIPTAHIGVPVIEQGRVIPKNMLNKSKDRVIVDFGECFTGVTSIKVKGPRGSRIVIRHAEVLNAEQELHLRGNRSARCRDTYILKGGGEELFQPGFTFHGFQFAEITGIDQVELLKIEGVQISSEMPDLTQFKCSNDMINTVFDMIRRTQRSNQFETPMDCCARDERLGWGMEGNHFAYAATYMNNQEAFVRKWAKDIWDGQRQSGVLEAIAPPMLMKDIEPFVGDLQSNHGVYMLYTLFRMYGDTQAVRNHYEKLQKYFDYMEKNSDRCVRIATSGDWLGILEDTEHSDFMHGYGDCSPAMLGTAHYAVVTRMMGAMSLGIGKMKEAEKYASLYSDIKKAFRHHFIQKDGTLRGGKQGDYLMALACDFFPKEFKDKAAEHLYADMTKSGHINWRGGTVTTPFFLRTLHELGRNDLANRFLASSDYPSIGFMHKKGATTLWERWDAIFEDGRIHPHAMNAMNHIGFTTVADYIIGGLAGIDTLETGFKEIVICPGVSEEVKSAQASYQSPYGEIFVLWEWDQGRVRLLCKIPANTTAQIILPCDTNKGLDMIIGEAEEILQGDGKIRVKVLSGMYEMFAGLESIKVEA